MAEEQAKTKQTTAGTTNVIDVTAQFSKPPEKATETKPPEKATETPPSDTARNDANDDGTIYKNE